MDFDLKARKICPFGHMLHHEEECLTCPEIAGELKAAYSAGLAEREKLEAAEAIFRGNIGAILVAMDGGNQTLAKHLLVRTLSALDGVKDGGR